MLNQNILISIFEKGISNSDFFNKKTHRCGLFKSILKILRLITFRLFGSSRKRLSSSKIKIVWYPLHEKVLINYEGDCIVLLDHNNNLSGFSFLFYVPISQIIQIIISIPKVALFNKLAYEWCFFRVIVSFFINNRVEDVTIAGHYDKFATWISYLSKDLNFFLTISQHGANSKYILPFKIPANRVETFSKAEEEMFKATILEPEKTCFFIKGFRTSLVFSSGDFQRKTIAIASQPSYEELVLKIMQIVREIDKSINIVVYSHPSDRFRKGKLSITNEVNCRLEHKERYWDIDYLLVFTSTLAYDYWSCETFEGRVLCYYDKNCIVALYDDVRATILYPETINSQLKEILLGVLWNE